MKQSRADLKKLIEEQQQQIITYEKKLKDVVRAYKGLTAERDALQTALNAVVPESESSRNKGSAGSTGVDKENSEVSDATQVDRIESLKKSLATLIAEKSRREAAFQADKKALMIENEALKERLQKAVNETEVQAEHLENRMKELHNKIKRIEKDREKELSDHGSVLAAVQQQYAKERAKCNQLGKQIAELYGKLKKAEKSPEHLEKDLSRLKEELKIADEEKNFLKKKAEKTPTVQMLESELRNYKESSQREIDELKLKAESTNSKEREARLIELEQRLQEMTTTLADFERSKIEQQNRVEVLLKRCKEEEEKCANLQKILDHQYDESTDALKERIMECARKLRQNNEDVNLYEILGLEETSKEQKRRYDLLKEEYERYKLKAQAVLKSRMIADTVDEAETSNNPTALNKCPSCAAADSDLHHMQMIVASLHGKLQALEIDHANAKNEYEEKSLQLQKRIVEMQLAQETSAHEIRNQMHQKVAEMEAEMQKQRVRTLDILSEKENELEMTKAILAAVRSQQTSDPMDPPQSAAPCSTRQSDRNVRSGSVTSFEEHKRSVGNERALSDEGSYSSVVDERRLERMSSSPADSHIPFIAGKNTVESRNLFYEQQLARRDKEIADLRNSVRTAELNMRDLQQSSLTKDLRYYEMVEKLKDEIRILEGKLVFFSGDANMEYLRNVFIQLLHCESASGRKHILKAIGTVLRLSSSEMRAIERR